MSETTTPALIDPPKQPLPPRELKVHQINGLNEHLDIQVLDGPGPGNACHRYRILLWSNPKTAIEPVYLVQEWNINFQKGPILEAGFNGLTCEALMAIVIDRLQGFSVGDYKTRENAIALTKMEEALMWLQKRTRDRLARGVEGTMQK